MVTSDEVVVSAFITLIADQMAGHFQVRQHFQRAEATLFPVFWIVVQPLRSPSSGSEAKAITSIGLPSSTRHWSCSSASIPFVAAARALGPSLGANKAAAPEMPASLTQRSPSRRAAPFLEAAITMPSRLTLPA